MTAQDVTTAALTLSAVALTTLIATAGGAR